MSEGAPSLLHPPFDPHQAFPRQAHFGFQPGQAFGERAGAVIGVFQLVEAFGDAAGPDQRAGALQVASLHHSLNQ